MCCVSVRPFSCAMDPGELQSQMLSEPLSFFFSPRHVGFVLVFVLLRAQFALIGGAHVFCACRVCEFAGACVLTVVTSEQSLESVAICRHRLFRFVLGSKVYLSITGLQILVF